MQRHILAKLEAKWYTLDKLLDLLLEGATWATAPNPISGDQEESDSLKLKYLTLLVEMSGLHKAKWWNALLSLTQIVYGKDKKN